MDLRRLACFVALAEELHFHRAAERCHMTQPALSQQLRALEGELQVRLMHRTRRVASLTRAGEVFLAEGRKLLKGASQAVEATQRAARGEIGQLRVGVTAPALFIVFPEIAHLFRQRLPGVGMLVEQMTTAEQEQALREGRIDVGVLHPPLDDPSLACEQFAAVPFKLVLSDRNPLAARRTLHMAELANEHFILFPRQIGPRLYDRIVALCQEAGFSPRIILETSPAQSIIGLAAGGFGVGWVASKRQQFPRTGVVYRTLRSGGPTLTLGVAYDGKSTQPELRAFVATAKQAGRMVRS